MEQKIYEFDELSGKAKEKAIESYSDINVDFDWWDFICDNTEYFSNLPKYKRLCCIEIQGFDLYNQSVNTNTEWEERSVEEIDAELIKLESNEKPAQVLLHYVLNTKEYEHVPLQVMFDDCKQVMSIYCTDEYILAACKNDIDLRAVWDIEAHFDKLDNNLKRELESDILAVLQDEYDYRTSDEAIAETIRCNKYEFNEDGSRYTSKAVSA